MNARDSAEFGLARSTAGDLRRVFEATPGIDRVWIFGSRARGNARANSDVDLAVDAPDMRATDFAALHSRLLDLPTLHKLDVVHWQSVIEPVFRTEIERDRQAFWEPRRHVANVDSLGSTHLKRFQTDVLAALAHWVDELKSHRANAEMAARALQAMEGVEALAHEAADFPKATWAALQKAALLPPTFARQPHSSRWDGAGRAIPNACLKVPTGGGKTLLAAASVARVFSAYLNRHTGLVLWVVPNEAIYRQTLKALSDRDHPYRQILTVAGAGRVKVLEKGAPLTRLDVESHLCVMVLMLQAASRKSKETLKFFRDRGNVTGFLPREDDIEAHWALLHCVPNLDAYAPWGASAEEARAQKGSIVKSSLGNVMRLVRPMVVIDERHHAYTDTALRTIDGFNPCFMLELSATPRIAGPKSSGSNILVDIRGSDLDEAEMIKLPIHVDVKRWNDWQSCLAASVQRLDDLQREAAALQAETARYIRPILLVQVERTGADLRDAGFIHAEDAKAQLLQLGFSERQIAIKTSDRNELKAPENIDLMSPTCEVRAIITKQALQEGWDCPFAYVLCALAAGRNPAAMTQLVGRILRQPHVAKTGRMALDACYVLCHDARTGDVVTAIKNSLEGEGMGDLALSVNDNNADSQVPKPLRLSRRAQFVSLRIFVPRVSWVEAGQPRRELVYDSDVLAHVPWMRVDPAKLATKWAPDLKAAGGESFALDLRILARPELQDEHVQSLGDQTLDRAQIVRGLLDITPNAWLVWEWVSSVTHRLLEAGFAESVLAASAASLTERLRVDIEAERDVLAQSVFEDLLQKRKIEFSLRADATDYELPSEVLLSLAGKPQPLMRDADARVVEKSLLEPALRLPDMNDYEARFACYLDQKAALRWWHRNVAKTQLGLQGWKRHKVYPDFIFAVAQSDGRTRTVLMETKGLHLSGGDTPYKQALLQRLTAAFRDERLVRAGGLQLEADGAEQLSCDLVFDVAWQGHMEDAYFRTASR